MLSAEVEISAQQSACVWGGGLQPGTRVSHSLAATPESFVKRDGSCKRWQGEWGCAWWEALHRLRRCSGRCLALQPPQRAGPDVVDCNGRARRVLLKPRSLSWSCYLAEVPQFRRVLRKEVSETTRKITKQFQQTTETTTNM